MREKCSGILKNLKRFSKKAAPRINNFKAMRDPI